VTLEAVTQFEVPQLIVERTEHALRDAGDDGYEMFVVWTGHRNGEVFRVADGHIPKQISSRTKNGLTVRIEGEALHHLNVWLYEHQQELAAQVHAHPTDAFHSETDDTFPVVTTLGGLSIVAADFCRDGLLAPSGAAFRLDQTGWNEVPLDVVQVV
jgi:hypothetical protein